MEKEKELFESMITIHERMEEINQRLDGLVDLVMGALDTVDELGDKVENATYYMLKKEIWSEDKKRD